MGILQWSNLARRVTVVVLVHVVLWTSGLALALWLRFDGDVPPRFAHAFWFALPFLIICRGATFYTSGLFHGMWKYAGLNELRNLVRGTTIATVAFVGFGALVHRAQFPRTVYTAEWALAIMLAGGVRIAIRIIRERSRATATGVRTRTAIVGAGDAGEHLLRDVQRAHPALNVVALLDDDPGKVDGIVHGVRVVGRPDEATLRRLIAERDVKLLLLAAPSASGDWTRAIVRICRQLGVQTKTVPSFADWMSGTGASALREVAIEDLLRRDPVALDLDRVDSLFRGRTVLVTGAAGSIGSELVRQALRFPLRRLILLDHNENGLFHLERELRVSRPDARLETLVTDISDADRVRSVFRRFRPEIVLHAAAHKHVPMMEANPGEAVRNNVLGTQIVADASHMCGANAFVMISTDKAVRPTSIMGATKRVAEMIVQSRGETSATRFVAVRFGNVLGSAGSVVPLFREQIARGGPVTVTHPEMRRYFMTIPEASQLVLQAASIAQKNEIFVLDMGPPVKIVDLARDLIELSGYRPDTDIRIAYTGTRAGEKLFEELILESEEFHRTTHPKIMVGKIVAPPAAELREGLGELARAVGDDAAVRRVLSSLVPEATLSPVRPPAPATPSSVLVASPSDGRYPVEA
jgi:FlaA1/EpsC-like NDP-sugar epimerase